VSPAAWLRRGFLALVTGGTGPDGDPGPAVEDCLDGRHVPGPGCDGRGCDSVPLVELEMGEAATVTCLEDAASAHARGLVALGVLPGVRVTVLQRSPAWVLAVGEMGHNELAVDRELAATVRVRRD
jgi:Fe2+ transport system protein FeoA